MAGMYGADVEQLRALARSFDTAATKLDGDRMSVGNAIRVSAWVGPVAVRFRAEWDSAHSIKVAQAAARLHTAASALRRNADDQERTSAVNGQSSARPFWSGGQGSPAYAAASPLSGGVIAAGIGTSLLGAAAGFAKGVHGVLAGALSVVDVPLGALDMGRIAKLALSGHGAENASKLEGLLTASKVGKVLDVVGKTVGLASVGVGVFDTVTKAADGDVGGAIVSGAKTALSVAALAPPPVGPIAGATSLAVTVLEIANPGLEDAMEDAAEAAVTSAASSAVEAVGAARRAAEDAGRAAGQFFGGISAAASRIRLW